MGMAIQETPAPLNETMALADLFVSGIARIEALEGGCFRFVLYVEHNDFSDRPERQAVASLIIPMENVPACLQAAAAALVRHGIKMLVRPPAMLS